jgi:exo-beta-1,3-glucanase (GH17 family)
VGINTIDNVANDIAKLITLLSGNWASVDTVYVGNEVVNNGGSVSALVAALGTARGLLSAAGFGGHIVAVDTFIAHAAHPEICANSDYCAANAHAFFDTTVEASQAGQWLINSAIPQIQKVANGKPIVITESGWPWKGQSNGSAVPSAENQQVAIQSIIQAMTGSSVGVYLFQAYDTLYRAPGALGIEQYFGIYGH